MPFFALVYKLMVPGETPVEAEPFVSIDLKLALVRFMRYLFIPSECLNVRSKDEGFQVEQCIAFVQQGLRETQDQPLCRVALNSLRLLVEMEKVIRANFDVAMDLINYTSRWLSHENLQLVEAALSAICIFVDDNDCLQRFLSVNGIHQLVSRIQTLNLTTGQTPSKNKALEEQIVERTLQIFLIIARREEIVLEIMTKNLLAPLLSLFNVKNSSVVSSLLQVLSLMAEAHPDFNEFFSEIPNLDELIF